MKARASAFIATSLDGFIARLDGSIDWLDDVQALIPEGEDCGYLEFMSTIDGLVMGRHTFERALAFEQWPYGQLPVYVMSHAPVSVPPALVTTRAFLPGHARGARGSIEQGEASATSTSTVARRSRGSCAPA